MNSMEQSPSGEAKGSSASQEMILVLWNPNFVIVFTTARHFSTSWMKLIQSYFFKVNFNIILSCTPVSS
jgi:hypothetical protein